MVTYNITNVVGSVTYQQELDLKELAETFTERDEITEVTYEPSENHWLQTRFVPDNTYVAFYRSGKCSIVGTNSPEEFYEIVEIVNTVMHDLLEFEYDPRIRISNIVVTSKLDTILHLEAVAIDLGLELVEYEPEQFPAIIYPGDKFVALVFSSGKIVITGLDDPNRIDQVVRDLNTIINNTRNHQ